MALVPSGFLWQWQGQKPCEDEVLGGEGLPAARVRLPGMPGRRPVLRMRVDQDSPRRVSAREIEDGHEFDINADTHVRWQYVAKGPRWGDRAVPATKLSITFDRRPVPERLRLALDELPEGLELVQRGFLTQERRDAGHEACEGYEGSIGFRHWRHGTLATWLRPWIVDAGGERAWADWEIDISGLWIVLPTRWIKSRRANDFPLTLDPYLGHESAGGLSATFGAPEIWAVGGAAYNPGEDGTATSVGWYGKLGSNDQCTAGLYGDSSSYPGSRLATGTGINVTTTAQWWSDTVSYAFTNGQVLYPGWSNAVDVQWRQYYADPGTDGFWYKNTGAYSHGAIADPFPSSASSWANHEFSVRVAYTAAGAAGHPARRRFAFMSAAPAALRGKVRMT